MNIVTFPNLVNALLEIRSPTAVRVDASDSENIYHAVPHDTFELTGRVVRLDTHGKTQYMAHYLVEGEFEPNDNKKWWVPLKISSHGPNHLVCDPNGNELGPLCYTEAEHKFW